MAAAEVSKTHPPRFMNLSLPKPPPIGFVPDRYSVYWDNGIPPKDYSKTTKFALLSRRQEELAQSKRTHPDYVPSRFPIWMPSPYALHAKISPRVESLAQPKRCHPDYRPGRIVTARVPIAAMLFNPSKRLCELARPKEYITLVNLKEDADWQTWELSENEHRIPPASQRVQVLADPKQLHERYVPPRGVKWDMSQEALSSVASERVIKLARPKSKHLDTEDYRANAWTVSSSALLAQASPRINELATPLPRKVRTKK